MTPHKEIAAAAIKNVHPTAERKMYSNETVEETATLKLTAFTHGQGTTWALFQKIEGQRQWSMLLRGQNEGLARRVYEHMKAGNQMERSLLNN
jgi:hypothetical protein